MWTLALSCLSCCSQPQAPAAAFETHRFENGVTLHVRQEPGAPKQATFSFLPLGLDGDGAGRAQFSHLAEHMMIRRTDPKTLRVKGITINGETTGRAMRLETFADPTSWRDALRRHAAWLTTRSCEPATLAREKVRIEGEERATVSRGFNHKWATAAWGQYASGRGHAAVHGDVASATSEQVVDYLESRVQLAAVRIFSIGPRSSAEQIKVLKAAFAAAAEQAGESNRSAEKEPQSAIQPGSKPRLLPTGHHSRTWDLAARHYLESFALPANCTALEAQTVAQMLMMATYQQPMLKKLPGYCAASHVRAGERNYLLVSCNLPKDQAVAELRAAIVKACASAARLLRFQVRGALVVKQLLTVPDFAKQRKMVRNPRFRDLIEAQFAMNIGYACVRNGLAPEELQAAHVALDGVKLAKMLTEAIQADDRASFTIEPK